MATEFKIAKGLKDSLPEAKTPGQVYFTTDEGKLYIDIDVDTRIEVNANVAAKLGTKDVGNATTPIYLAKGVPTAGTPPASYKPSGTTSQVLLGDGSAKDITALEKVKAARTADTATKLGTETVGSATIPIYLEEGVPKAGTAPSSFKPSGTETQVLLGTGTPKDITSLGKVASAATADTATKATNADSAIKLGSTTIGSTIIPVYLDTGTPKAATGVVPNTRKVAGKALSGDVTLVASDVGAATKPSAVKLTLTSSGWSSNTQTVNCTGVVVDEAAQEVDICPAVAQFKDYMDAGIYVSAVAAGKLTFTCSTAPTKNIVVYVKIQNI